MRRRVENSPRRSMMAYMGTLSVRVRYRPFRIGWCVREGDLDDVRRVLRLTHTLWGGRYNPIIPIDHRASASQLVDLFRVDALYPAADDPQVDEFIKTFPYLPCHSSIRTSLLTECMVSWQHSLTSTTPSATFLKST